MDDLNQDLLDLSNSDGGDRLHVLLKDVKDGQELASDGNLVVGVFPVVNGRVQTRSGARGTALEDGIDDGLNLLDVSDFGGVVLLADRSYFRPGGRRTARGGAAGACRRSHGRG